MNLTDEAAISLITHSLSQMGALFTIVSKDGELFESETAPSAIPAPTPKRRCFKAYEYQRLMDNLGIGESTVFDTPDQATAKSLQGAVSGYATGKFGPKRYNTGVNGKAVFAIRMA